MEQEDVVSSAEEEDPYHNSSESDPDYVPPTKISAFRPCFNPNINNSTTSSSEPLSPPTDTSEYSKPSTSSMSIAEPESSFSEQTNYGRFKNTPMLDGKFFKPTKSDGKMHVEAICQLCLPLKKTIKGSLETTTNFVKHLRRVHGDHSYNEYVKYKSEKKKEKQSEESKDGLHPTRNRVDKKLKQGTLTKFMNPSGQLTQKSFDKKVINFIINTMSALSIIENPSFLNLFDGMNVKVLGRKAAMRVITDMYNCHLEDLKAEIQKQDFVCSTADIWSTKQRSFMGITLHWIDSNLNRKSVALACKRFYGTHDYKNIGEMLENVNLKFGIRSTQIIATVTDNGSNFVKAFREFGAGESSDELPSNSDNDEDFDGVEEEEACDAEIDFEEIDFAERRISLSTHVRCASHTLNLIATVDCKNAIQSNVSIRTRHTKAFAKCNEIWIKARRPKTAEIIKEVLGHTLSYPGITRWNAFYDSVSQVLSEKPKLSTLFKRLNLNYFKETELQYLEEYCLVMRPLAATLDVLQGQECIYYGFLLPSLLSLRNKWEKLYLQEISNAGKLLLSTCLQNLERRFSNILNLESEQAIISAIVHPKFKLRWYNVLKNPITTMDTMKKMVITAAEKLIGVDSFEELAEPVSTDIDGFFDFNESENPSKQLSIAIAPENGKLITPKIELELYKFLDEKRTNLQALNEYSIIKRVFIRYNTCLPSSAPVERLFSFASIINSPRRHALTDENFEKLVIMKSNKINL